MPWSLSGDAAPAASRRDLVILLVALAGLLGFALLAISFDGRLGDLDRELSEWVALHMPAWAEWAARPLSWLGGWIGLTALGVATALALVAARAWLDTAFFAVAFLGSQLVVALLKDGFDRPRPDAGSAVPLPDSSSFPSGHATAGAASLGAVAVLLATRLPSRRDRARLWIAVAILGLAIGLSRIVLNVHHLSDVAAGWCLGVAWLALCLLARDRLRAGGA